MHKLDTMTSMPEFTGSMALSLLENLIRLKKKKCTKAFCAFFSSSDIRHLIFMLSSWCNKMFIFAANAIMILWDEK